MTTIKLSEMALILSRLSDAYGTKLADQQIRAYHMVLSAYPRMVLAQAALQLMRTSKFYPRISEFAQVANRINGTYTEPDWAKVDEAAMWHMFRKNMTSTDDFSEADVQQVYADAGIAMTGVVG